MKKPRLAAIVCALACAAGAAGLPSVGCNGTGVTPICTFADGAIDPEAGCGTPVEASTSADGTLDSTDDQSATPVGDDSSPVDEGDASGDAGSLDAADSSQDAADAHVDAGHDAAIQDAHSDSKG